MKNFIIRLENLLFRSRIGVFPEERENLNDFEVNVSVSIDAGAFEPENLETSVSYAEIYEIIKEEMSEISMLLETVAVRIADRISSKWNQILTINVKITKINPPIPGIKGTCSVEYVKN